jgi:hypothetical protein
VARYLISCNLHGWVYGVWLMADDDRLAPFEFLERSRRVVWLVFRWDGMGEVAPSALDNA